MALIIKKAGKKHFTKTWKCGATSDRVVLPEQDRVNVKVTHLFAPVGAEWLDISYPVDETVYILSGEARLTVDGETFIVRAGDTYVCPAGQVYTLNVDNVNTEIFCVFSPTQDGVSVNND